MPKNKGYNKSKKRNGKKAPPKLTMSKPLESYIGNEIDKKIETKAETKYLNTALGAYHSIDMNDPLVDSVNNRVLIDITPEVVAGDTYLNRIGDRVSMLYYQLRMRVHPELVANVYQHGQATPSTSLFPQTTYLNAHLIQADATSAMTAGDYDYCIRRPMENWMDTKQTGARAHRKEFKVLKSFKIPLKFNNVCLLDSSTIPCEYNVTSFPMISYVDQKLKIDRKTLFNANSADKPVKVQYKLFITWGNYFRNTFVDVDFPTIDYWQSWTFKDV